MGYETLLVDGIDSKIVTVTLNRPKQLNALTTQMADELRELSAELHANKPRAVVLVSGSDLSVLRTIPMESRNLATAVTGTFALGDVDRDGVPDWLVGIHVSQSDDHDAPRACRLGLIALVSGGDFHLIKSLERESFLSGSGRQCPVVTLPEAVQP
jgi:hypothetical protein